MSRNLIGRGNRPSGRRPRAFAAGLVFVALVLMSAGPPADAVSAAEPQLGRIVPPGGQRGTELDVALEGARLADAQEMLLYYPGIEVKQLTVADGQVKARLAIAPDCRIGPHALRLRTASGISNLITFSVGALPEINEAEPNTDFAQPQQITPGVTINGVVENEDVDYFVLEAKKGRRLTAEVEGLRLGEFFFDPYVAIYDKDRFMLAGSDDTPLVRQDAVAAAIAPEDGPYIIQVRESAFGGNGQCRYRLHVGSFPRPQAVYPAGGKFGETIEVRWLGDPAGEWTEKVTLPAEPQPMFGLVALDPQGAAPSANVFRLGNLNNVMEAEPNNAPAEATAAPVPAAMNGVVGEPGDVDHFKFPAKKGQVFDVRAHARQIRSPLDPVLTILRASNGAGVGANDDSGTPDSYLRVTIPEDDDYVLQIRDHLGAGGAAYVYRIEVAPVEPKLTMTLPERVAFTDIVIPVPKGNRMAAMAGARREDFGGEVAVETQGLPPGITPELYPIADGLSDAPMLFTAAADAAAAGALVDLVGRHQRDSLALEGHLEQRTSLIRGQNNVEVWNHYTNRMAVAVTAAVPFKVDIVEPKVPLVRSGEMQLKVVATREGDFKAPINLRMLYNPPGVSSPSVVTIPADQNEAIIPLTANGSATVRQWKIAVLADAPVGDGPITVSTQLANLEVAEPFFKFTFPSIAVEKGQETALAIAIEKVKDFEGAAKVELLGTPNEVTSTPQEFTKDTTQITFPVKTTANSPAGQHKSLICRAVVTANGEPITHMIGTGELRIQEPLPQPAAQTAPPPAAAPPPPQEKPLSRLEQLRLKANQ
ncbi:MAG: hypothetical protein KJZ87_07770 [Thermoguttaceae bacterium]|nr:hypothetical protein [Thermoguttaceae bacterium]